MQLFHPDFERPKIIRRLTATAGGKLADDITAHIFRHSWLTDLYYAGVDAKSAQYLGGHATIQMTMDTYTHLDREREAANVSKLNQFYPKSRIIYTQNEKSRIYLWKAQCLCGFHAEFYFSICYNNMYSNEVKRYIIKSIWKVGRIRKSIDSLILSKIKSCFTHRKTVPGLKGFHKNMKIQKTKATNVLWRLSFI